jgi:hypothetical protein
MPVISNYSPHHTIFSPINILNNCTQHYEEGSLLQAIKATTELSTFNIDKYPTEDEDKHRSPFITF